MKQFQLREAEKLLKQHRQREQFAAGGPKRVLSNSKHDTTTTTPNLSDMQEFWGNLLGVEGEFDKLHPGIVKWRQPLKEIDRPASPEFDHELWLRVLGRMKNWKAPGRDKLHGYWWKCFPLFRERVGVALWAVTRNPTQIPAWIVHGRTVLIPKEGCEGRPEQFRPITCLNTQYKLLTAILSEVLHSHVNDNGLLPVQQRALMRKHRGCHDALLADQMMTEDARLRKKVCQ